MKLIFPTLFVIVLIAFFSSCQKGSGRGHEDLEARDAVMGESIYQLEAKLADQNGRQIGLDLYRGSPVVISMFYASCPYSCPMTIDSIRTKIEDKIDPETRSQLRVLLISFDPEADTPQALKGLAQKRKIDLSRWTLASGASDEVREIAAVLGVQYHKLPDGNFNHSSVIALLDPQGVLLTRVDGLNQPFDAIVDRLSNLQN